MNRRAWPLFMGLVVTSVGWPVLARAGGFPPVAQASAEAAEVVVGADLQFSSEGSFDPDEAPEPIRFAWSFDDGGTSTEASPVHAFDAPGAYHVTLVVTDGADSTEASVTVFVLAPIASPAPAWSAPIVLLEDRAELWVVSPDTDSVAVVGADSLSLVRTIAVCDEPVALAATGDECVVVCAGSGEVVRLDAASREVSARRRVGVRLGGVVALPDGRALVTLPAEGALVVLGAGDLTEVARFEIGGEPRAVARTGRGDRAFVASFLSEGAAGRVVAVELARSTTEDIALAMDPGPDSPSSARGLPNLLGALAIDPAEQTLWIGGLKSNIERGSFRDGLPLTDDTRVRGIMTPVDLATSTETLDGRIDTNDADAVSAIAFSPAGRFAYVAHPGLGSMSTYDLASLRLFSPGRGSTIPFRSRVEVGDRPDGIVVSRDGTRMFVSASLSRAVVAFDLADPAVPVRIGSVELTPETLSPMVALGRVLFHRSGAPIHSRSGYVACASCHPDGGHDGQTWDFTHGGEGLRNTIDLRGPAGTATGPLHWSGNFDEVQDFENDIVHQFGGSGLSADGAPPNPPLGAPNAGRSRELDALAAYVESLDEAPRSPHRSPDGGYTESALRGRLVFDGAGCRDCHSGPAFTNSTLDRPFVFYDVGTLGDGSGLRLGEPLTGIDTPSLLGAWGSAPYFHDGSARTLEAVVERDTGDLHGMTSSLGPGARADLVAYLQEIDRAEMDLPPRAGGCGCRIATSRPAPGRDAGSAALALVLGLGLAARRRARNIGDGLPESRTIHEKLRSAPRVAPQGGSDG